MVELFRDMTGKEIKVSFPPKRIVSLVPSQTELLYDLELEEQVVGITKFCVHPESWFRSKQRIGGTKHLNISKIKSLQPDLIIANKEENERDQIEQLSLEFPVWTSDISNIDDALNMIKQVGMITGQLSKAEEIIANIQTCQKCLVDRAVQDTRKAAYFIWYKPWMTVGGDTYINSMMEMAGLKNVFKSSTRYSETPLQELERLKPDTILLSSEPFPFKDLHVAEMKAAVPSADVMLVDGEMFSWYGSRMIKAIPYLKTLINTI